MQKKALPFLIALMCLALAGIILIQFLWIRKSVREKQALIDSKVIQSISNTDLRLSDAGTIAFFTQTTSLPGSDTLIQSHKLDTILQDMSPMHLNNLPGATNYEVQVITTQQMQEDSALFTHTQIVSNQSVADSIRIELSQIENELLQLEEVRTVFDRIRFEVDSGSVDLRLDSTRIDQTLKTELRSFELDTAIVWNVYDSQQQEFLFGSTTEASHSYKVPLFKNDVVHPGRYLLEMHFLSNEKLIWRDIQLMVYLSILFTIIILSAFLLSVKLILKHKKISQIKSDFINNMTHEFKTPLASISLAADSIVHPSVSGDPEKIKAYVQMIHEEKSKLNQNVERILEVASLEQSSFEFPLERVELSAILVKSLENLQLHLNQKRGTVETNLEQSVFIQGNAFHLIQAFSNVIENSIKYTEESPQINVLLKTNQTMATVVIRDFGIGMTPPQLERVFDSFYRAETGNIHNTKGFGLGLTYARYIIEKMQGKIGIESTYRKGTTVTIQFPKV